MPTRIAILGSGAWATACSLLLCEQDSQQVTMWTREAATADRMTRERENVRLLPGVRLPDRLTITADIERATAEVDYLVVAVPTKFLRQSLTTIAPHVRNRPTVVSVIKGIENGTLARPTEIIRECLNVADVAVLSGPSHAEEVARRLPASVVAAAADPLLARRVQEMFTTDRFRVYSNSDLLGVELAGALKNVIGIAAGICHGLGFGDNALSALMTRGIVEITRFGCALGAEAGTFAGLAGIGDLITTCISPHGRNRMVGERIGRGESLSAILGSMASVAEGVNTAQSVHDLAREKHVEMPICEQVYNVLFQGRSPYEATSALMMRPPREE